MIRAEDALNVEHPIEIQLQREGKVVETATVSNQSVYALQVDAFADAVEGKSRFPIPGEEGWRNQEVLDAAMRSLRTGKSENVPRVRCRLYGDSCRLRAEVQCWLDEPGRGSICGCGDPKKASVLGIRV